MTKIIWNWDGSIIKEIELIKKDAPAKSEGLMAKVRHATLEKASNILANIIIFAMLIALTIILYLAITHILQIAGFDTTLITDFFIKIWQWVESFIEKFSVLKKML